MAAGLFELRKDAITGWWVATVVDRRFDLTRFARAAASVVEQLEHCDNCSIPPGDGVRVRMLKDYAFHVVGMSDSLKPASASISLQYWMCIVCCFIGNA